MSHVKLCEEFLHTFIGFVLECNVSSLSGTVQNVFVIIKKYTKSTFASFVLANNNSMTLPLHRHPLTTTADLQVRLVYSVFSCSTTRAVCHPSSAAGVELGEEAVIDASSFNVLVPLKWHNFKNILR